MLRCGEKNQRITFQEQATTQNALGETTGAWANLATLPTVWAKATPLNGKEFFATGQMQATADVLFEIDYRADVTSKMRVLWRGLPYEIVAPPQDAKAARRGMQIFCTQGLRDGR